MRELSLFTGAGGGLLGSLVLGWRTVAAVEYDPYCQRVLCARGGYVADAERQQDDAKRGGPGRHREQQGRAVDAGSEATRQTDWAPGHDGTDGRGSFPIHSDVRTFDAAQYRGRVDIVTGGFPCQPHSQAGKRLGGLDSRDLWPDTVRILRESGAPIGFFENVPGLLTSRDDAGLPYFGRILGDLSETGFDAEWIVLGADDVGAPHRRKRLWILAYRDGGRREQRDPGLGPIPVPESQRHPISPWHIDPADVAHAMRAGGQQERGSTHGDEGQDEGWPADDDHELSSCGEGVDYRDWLAEPYVGRVANGVAKRVDRLRALGNGQVPQAMAAAFTILAARAGLTA